MNYVYKEGCMICWWAISPSSVSLWWCKYCSRSGRKSSQRCAPIYHAVIWRNVYIFQIYCARTIYRCLGCCPRLAGTWLPWVTKFTLIPLTQDSMSLFRVLMYPYPLGVSPLHLLAVPPTEDLLSFSLFGGNNDVIRKELNLTPFVLSQAIKYMVWDNNYK